MSSPDSFEHMASYENHNLSSSSSLSSRRSSTTSSSGLSSNYTTSTVTPEIRKSSSSNLSSWIPTHTRRRSFQETIYTTTTTTYRFSVRCRPPSPPTSLHSSQHEQERLVSEREQRTEIVSSETSLASQTSTYRHHCRCMSVPYLSLSRDLLQGTNADKENQEETPQFRDSLMEPSSPLFPKYIASQKIPSLWDTSDSPSCLPSENPRKSASSVSSTTSAFSLPSLSYSACEEHHSTRKSNETLGEHEWPEFNDFSCAREVPRYSRSSPPSPLQSRRNATYPNASLPFNHRPFSPNVTRQSLSRPASHGSASASPAKSFALRQYAHQVASAIAPIQQTFRVSVYLFISCLATAVLLSILCASYGLTLADDIRDRIIDAKVQAVEAGKWINETVDETQQLLWEEIEKYRKSYEERRSLNEFASPTPSSQSRDKFEKARQGKLDGLLDWLLPGFAALMRCRIFQARSAGYRFFSSFALPQKYPVSYNSRRRSRTSPTSSGSSTPSGYSSPTPPSHLPKATLPPRPPFKILVPSVMLAVLLGLFEASRRGGLWTMMWPMKADRMQQRKRSYESKTGSRYRP